MLELWRGDPRQIPHCATRATLQNVFTSFVLLPSHGSLVYEWEGKPNRRKQQKLFSQCTRNGSAMVNCSEHPFRSCDTRLHPYKFPYLREYRVEKECWGDVPHILHEHDKELEPRGCTFQKLCGVD